jgi:uncharacterized protein YndB with AHSA1/START domain
MTEKTKPGIVIERTYKARVEELWELWTTKKACVVCRRTFAPTAYA